MGLVTDRLREALLSGVIKIDYRPEQFPEWPEIERRRLVEVDPVTGRARCIVEIVPVGHTILDV